MKYEKHVQFQLGNKTITAKIRDGDYINAFSLYNGDIILTSASLNLKEEEIKAMIAHELGHIKLHHHIKMLILINILVFALLNSVTNILFFIPLAITLILFQRYLSRFFELQADSFATRIVDKEVLHEIIIKYGERKSNILSTHPSALTRIKKI
ncbi:M48 family metalloprotease [Acidianus manzaensis]|nr:M48 family metalloprotease [Acidianus manzaensis]